MAVGNLNKSKETIPTTTTASKYIPRRTKISNKLKSHISNIFFEVNFQKISDHSEIFFALQYIKNWTKVVALKKKILFLKKKFVSLKKNSFEILWSEVWKVGFQFMLILGLLGVYFDAAVVFVTKSSLLFRLAVAILCMEEGSWTNVRRKSF